MFDVNEAALYRVRIIFIPGQLLRKYPFFLLHQFTTIRSTTKYYFTYSISDYLHDYRMQKKVAGKIIVLAHMITNVSV